MTIPAKKIALLGVFGSGNFGNDASMEAMLQALRRTSPGAVIACICPDPQVVARSHGIPAILMSWSGFGAAWFQILNCLLLRVPTRLTNVVRALLHIRRFDLLIIPGTGIFDDFGEGPWSVPFGVFRWCVAAWLCRTRIALVSVGAGPIHHPLSRWFMKSAMRLASYRSFRDGYSRDYMGSIGFDASADPVRPDLAFVLAPPAPAPAGAQHGDSLTVGVGLMTYYGWRNDAFAGAAQFERYVGKMVAFTLGLLDSGHQVQLLIGDANDRIALDALLAYVEAARPDLAPGRIVASPIASLDDVMGVVAACDVVLATRFHNVVGALALGKPVISVGYAKKNDMLLAGLGLGDFCQHIESLDPDLLMRQFRALAAGRGGYAALVRLGIAGLRTELKVQEAELAMLFLQEAQPATVPAQGAPAL